MHKYLLVLLLLVLSAIHPGDVMASHLVIQGSDGRKHSFEVEIARTEEEQHVGLMWRNYLAPDAGMLFVFDRDKPVSMWMKNTLISLDMIFITSDGVISAIVSEAVPLSTTIIHSPGPVKAILELNGGICEQKGIRSGARVKY